MYVEYRNNGYWLPWNIDKCLSMRKKIKSETLKQSLMITKLKKNTKDRGINEKGISMDGDGKNFKVTHVSSFKKCLFG